ncbi:hypothetical protein ACG2K1_03230 [Neisseria sp. 23W00296]
MPLRISVSYQFLSNETGKMMFIPTRKFFKPFNAALAALLLACAAPA